MNRYEDQVRSNILLLGFLRMASRLISTETALHITEHVTPYMRCKLSMDVVKRSCTNMSAKQGFVRSASMAASAKAVRDAGRFRILSTFRLVRLQARGHAGCPVSKQSDSYVDF